VVQAATQLLPMIDSRKGPAAAAALAALQQLVKDAKGLTAGPEDVATLAALQQRVNARADLIIGRLRTGP
jgi:hypothetical protein